MQEMYLAYVLGVNVRRFRAVDMSNQPTNTYLHTHTHTHTHAYIHTYIHTHTQYTKYTQYTQYTQYTHTHTSENLKCVRD